MIDDWVVVCAMRHHTTVVVVLIIRMHSIPFNCTFGCWRNYRPPEWRRRGACLIAIDFWGVSHHPRWKSQKEISITALYANTSNMSRILRGLPFINARKGRLYVPLYKPSAIKIDSIECIMYTFETGAIAVRCRPVPSVSVPRAITAERVTHHGIMHNAERLT